MVAAHSVRGSEGRASLAKQMTKAAYLASVILGLEPRIYRRFMSST
jgi:hypothetical protein